MPKVVHFELPADDLDRAKAFYSSVFEWEIETVPLPGLGDYAGAVTTPVDPDTQIPLERGAINGALVSRDSSTPTPVVSLDVEAIDDALKAVEDGGGKVAVPRTEIPGMGAFAYFADTEGNVVGLWESPR